VRENPLAANFAPGCHGSPASLPHSPTAHRFTEACRPAIKLKWQ
jgi:hypothetical protein